MSQDPYGFKEQVAPNADPMGNLWGGVVAAVCAGIGMCGCYVPFFIGAPLGLYSAFKANQALQVATDPRDRAVATAGMVTGLAGGLVCAAWAAFILMYVMFILLYMVVGFAAIAAAGSQY